MSDSCRFCKIAAGEVNAEIVYRDEQATAFLDIHPVAPTHILIVPNKHIESVHALEPEDEPLMGHLFTVARQLAEVMGGRVTLESRPGRTVFALELEAVAEVAQSREPALA